MVEMVSSARPPRLSAIRGAKSKFREQQAERLEVSLHWTPTRSACPGDTEASDRVLLCRGLMTCMSRAAGRPLCHAGRLSAGFYHRYHYSQFGGHQPTCPLHTGSVKGSGGVSNVT